MAEQDPRMTGPTLKVLGALLAAPGISGAEIIRATDVQSGTLYPILYRLAAAGWVEGEWEDIDPIAEGRPQRRFYRMTNRGTAKATAVLQELRGVLDAVETSRETQSDSSRLADTAGKGQAIG